MPTPPAGPIQPTPEQLSKLRSELDIVNGNMRVLREMLSELAPGKEDPADFSLLQELYHTCKVMQQRLVELLQSVANEEVTSKCTLPRGQGGTAPLGGSPSRRAPHLVKIFGAPS